MVSNASDDLPDPLKPVMTTSLSRGKSTSMFFKLCSRAPRTVIDLFMRCSISGRRGRVKPQTPDICATRDEIATSSLVNHVGLRYRGAVAFVATPAYGRDEYA